MDTGVQGGVLHPAEGGDHAGVARGDGLDGGQGGGGEADQNGGGQQQGCQSLLSLALQDSKGGHAYNQDSEGKQQFGHGGFSFLSSPVQAGCAGAP